MLTARFPDGTAYVDNRDITSARDRESFVAAVLERCPGVDAEAIAASVEQLATDAAVAPDRVASQPTSQPAAEALVEIASECELFHTGEGHDAEPCATISVGDHLETWPIGHRAFQRWLARQYYAAHGKAPKSQALQDAIGVIAGRALFEGQSLDTCVRIAGGDRRVFLDLGDPDWRVVEITPSGWRLRSNVDLPFRFVRRRGMAALPEPLSGGSIDELRPLINVPSDDDWTLVVAWIVMTFHPRGPYPILIVEGEQGSAKSTLCRLVRALIDPNKAPIRRPPQSDRDIMIAANNQWVLAYDNLSGISVSLSDALCMLATGGGFGTRELYSDDEERIFQAARPVILNGIDRVATRSDLLDRAIRLTLPVILDGTHVEEETIYRRFDAMHGRVLGALLDAVACALTRIASVTLDTRPRMADFARWTVAAEPALPIPAGRFMNVYGGNRRASHEEAIEESPVGSVLYPMIVEEKSWSGTIGDLLKILTERADERTRRSKEWPAKARGLSAQLTRLAPDLRATGIAIRIPKQRSKRGRRIELEWRGQPSPSSPPSPEGPATDGPTEDCTEPHPADSCCATPLDAAGFQTPEFVANDDGDGGDDLQGDCGGEQEAFDWPDEVPPTCRW
jgi:hypothetical protein